LNMCKIIGFVCQLWWLGEHIRQSTQCTVQTRWSGVPWLTMRDWCYVALINYKNKLRYLD